MQTLQTVHDGVIIAGDVKDLKDLLICNCGYDIWDFISADQYIKSNYGQDINELEEDSIEKDYEIEKLNDLLFKANQLVEVLNEKLIISEKPVETVKESFDDEDYVTF